MKVWTALLLLPLMTGPLILSSPFTAPGFAAPAAIAITSTPAQDAVAALTRQPSGPLPAGTRLLSINLANGLATVDFSHELRDHFAGGDAQEVRTVSAVLRALGQFPTIDLVQLRVEGEPVETLGGLLTLSGPLPVIRSSAIKTKA